MDLFLRSTRIFQKNYQVKILRSQKSKFWSVILCHIYTTNINVSREVNSVPQKLPIQILKGRFHLVSVGIKRNRVLTAFSLLGRGVGPPLIIDPPPTSSITLLIFLIFFCFYIWHVTCDIWHVTCDTWQVTRDTWHVTRNTWHLTCDRLGEVNLH